MAESEIERRAPDVADANVPPALGGEAPAPAGARDRPDWSAIRAVFFDLDDTLCAYWVASKAALRATFERCHPREVSPEAMFEHWAAVFTEFCPSLRAQGWYEAYLQSGESTRTEQMRLALRRAGAFDEDLAILMSQTYGAERDRCLTLFDDATKVLDELRVLYRLGLITNGPADIQRQEIATLGIESYFQTILIEGELGFGKPHEKVFRIAEQATGLGPESMLFVGNSYRHDVAPALRAGWHAIWVRRETDVPIGSANPEPIPEDSPLPDAVVDNLTEVVRLLRR